MPKKQILIIIFTVAFVLLAGVLATVLFLVYEPGSFTEPQNSVVLISIDGLRWDYLSSVYQNDSFPNLQSILDTGVHAEWLDPIFPSKTFPNHYTIVTGLYAESHGIVSNTFFDPEFNATFRISNEAAVTDGRWWQGEPFWVTAEKQGLRSGCLFWPGSEAEIGGYRPTYYKKYDQSLSYDARVDQLLEWMGLPEEERPAFYTIYFEGVDSEGHAHGPDSPEVLEALQEVDAALGRLLDGIAFDLNASQTTNLIVVSDHGMTQLSREKVVILDELLSDMSAVDLVDIGPVTAIIPHDLAETDSIVDSLKASEHLLVYKKEDIPEHFHYQDNRRITPIIAVAQIGYSVTTQAYFDGNPNAFTGGNHGYDPASPDMRAFFAANGPLFINQPVGSVKNVDIYELLGALLEVEVAPNNGTLANVESLLNIVEA